MSITHKKLPAFGALLAYEAVVRHGSFTAAAREFGVSQAAVSQKVREFEAWLDVYLIERTRPKLVVSEVGITLAERIGGCITDLARAHDQAKLAKQNPNRVTLASTNAFAVYWLSSRIDTFYARHPDIEFSLATSDPEITVSGFHFDIGIVYSPDPPTEYPATELFSSQVVAVASEKYLSDRPAGLGPGQWPHDTLLHLTPDPWMSWQDWLSAVDLPHVEGLHSAYHTTFITLIHAVMAGRGIGLGWRRLVDPLLQNDDIVQLGSYATQPDGAYYLVENPDRSVTNQGAIRMLKDWLLDQARD